MSMIEGLPNDYPIMAVRSWSHSIYIVSERDSTVFTKTCVYDVDIKPDFFAYRFVSNLTYLINQW